MPKLNLTNDIRNETMRLLLKDQQDEINAHHIYSLAAGFTKDEHNAEIIKKISRDELKHYHRLKSITGHEIKPQKRKIK